jgi:hypothetical protein
MKQVIEMPFWTALSLQAVIIKQSQGGCIACHAKAPGPHDEGCPVSSLYTAIRIAEENGGGAPPRSSQRGGARPGAGRTASRRGGARPGAGRKSNRGGARPGAGRKPTTAKSAKKRTPARKAAPRKATPRKRTGKGGEPSTGTGGNSGGPQITTPPAA